MAILWLCEYSEYEYRTQYCFWLILENTKKTFCLNFPSIPEFTILATIFYWTTTLQSVMEKSPITVIVLIFVFSGARQSAFVCVCIKIYRHQKSIHPFSAFHYNSMAFRKNIKAFGNENTGKDPYFKHVKASVVLFKHIGALTKCHVIIRPCFL